MGRERLRGLTGDLGDEVVILVNGQDRQPAFSAVAAISRSGMDGKQGSRPNHHLVGRSGRRENVAMKIKRVVRDLRTSDFRRTADAHVAVLGLDVIMDHGWTVTLAGSEGHQLSIVEEDASAPENSAVSAFVDDVGTHSS